MFVVMNLPVVLYFVLVLKGVPTLTRCNLHLHLKMLNTISLIDLYIRRISYAKFCQSKRKVLKSTWQKICKDVDVHEKNNEPKNEKKDANYFRTLLLHRKQLLLCI